MSARDPGPPHHLLPVRGVGHLMLRRRRLGQPRRRGLLGPQMPGHGLIMQSLAAANLRQAARLRRARCFRRRAETVCFEE